jgi:hypothetical protein
MIIKINDTDRTSLVEWSSIQILDAITNEVDTLSFNIKVFYDGDFIPEVGKEVEVTDDGTTIFAGEIVRVTKEAEGSGWLTYNIYCEDYTYELDKNLVFDTYENQDVSDIVKAIIDDYCDGFTYTNVDTTGIELDYILFNYEQPSKCIQRLAEMVGYDWYVDYDKDIHFFDKRIGETAAFDLTDTNGNYVFDSLKIEEDQTQVRNVVYVRGGEYVGDETEDKVGEGDGEIKSFKLPYRYNESPTVTVDGSAQTVGVEFIDDAGDYDCLWNYQEKVIRFDTAPASGDVVVSGKPLIPVIIRAKRTASIEKYGEREHIILDKKIKSKQLARQRAEAEFEDFASPTKVARFVTVKPGLKSGQKINIKSEKRSIDQDFSIEKITKRMRSPKEGFYYNVTASTGNRLGILRFLQEQIESTNNKVGVFRQENEILDLITDLISIDTITISEDLKINDEDTKIDIESVDTITVGETFIRASLDSPPTWVYGEYFPTDDADRKRPAFFDRSCLYA